VTPEHQPDHHSFVINLPQGQAVLDYRLLPGGGIDIHHTFVPDSLRGQGVAARLMQGALAWADSQQRPVQASCSYAATYLRRQGRG